MVHRCSVDRLFAVPPQADSRVRAAVGEDEARLRHLENLLDEWVRFQPHLPADYDRKMARSFIRGSKYNLETAKRKLEGYFLAKHAFPEFYRKRDPAGEDLTKAMDCVNIVRLPKFTEEGERITFMSLANPDPAQFDMVANIKLYWMLYDITLTSDHPITGEVFVFDGNHFSKNHLVKFLCLAFKQAVTILRDAYATRLSQIHVINCPAVAETIVSTIRPLLPEKVRQRIILHKGTQSLSKHLDPALLPADVGGDLESVRDYMKRWREFLLENSNWFLQQEEVKMVGIPPKEINKFTYNTGVEGSFRQLNID